jgi:Tfp pilus assembly PilM family ATPase
MMQREIATGIVDIIHIEPVDKDRFESDNYFYDVVKKIVKAYKSGLKTRNVVLSVPSYMAVTRILEADAAAEDLDAQIGWEFEQQAVGKGAGRYLDWMKLGTLPSNNENYLATSIEMQRLDFITAALRKARLNPVICDLDIFALSNIFEYNYPEEAKGNFIVLVDICRGNASLCMIRQGKYLDSDFIPAGNLNDPDAIASLAQRIEYSIYEMVRQAGVDQASQVNKLVMSGENMVKPEFAEAFNTASKLKIEIMEPLKNMVVVGDIAEQVEPIAPALAVVAGLTLRTPEEVA